VAIGAGGPHIADESWELDRGCDSVLWCGLPLLRGVDLRGVDLAAYSAYLDCCFRAAACIAFYSQMYVLSMNIRFNHRFCSMLGI
jgi:hypothetical protein